MQRHWQLSIGLLFLSIIVFAIEIMSLQAMMGQHLWLWSIPILSLVSLLYSFYRADDTRLEGGIDYPHSTAGEHLVEHPFIVQMKAIIQTMMDDAKATQNAGYITAQMSVYKDTCLGLGIAEQVVDSLEVKPTDSYGVLYPKLKARLHLKIRQMSQYPFPVKDIEGFAVGAMVDFLNEVDAKHADFLVQQNNNEILSP